MSENMAYDGQILEAFAAGKKPPMRFSEDEKLVIAQMLKRMEVRKKRAVPQRYVTSSELFSSKNGIAGIN
jgi:hypothetical protein